MPVERQIRVFVSSTFRDMHAEREELVKRVFPQLRKLCESRGVAWSEVDLRWGVPDEQKAEGKVLSICLAEIRNCRPYFIGLLGERYGWIPTTISPEVIEREPWLTGYRERSVTELEILHGVLNNPDMAGQALFYFRDPAYLDTIPQDQRARYEESPSPEEIAGHGSEQAEALADSRRTRLAELKQRIRESRLRLRENYADARSLGTLVLADLKEIVERLYPEGTAPNPLDQDAAEHSAYARSRARVYVHRESDFVRLDQHAAENGPPLVILGESGCGKSALLANWALRYTAMHPNDTLIQHYIGASPQSADWAAMLRRIMGELQRVADIPDAIPREPQALRSAFAIWLHLAAKKQKLVLIIDAVNQLEERDGAPDLIWLPLVLPTNVRILLSTLPGRSLEAIRKRVWTTHTVEPLDPAERRRLVVEYLTQYGKRLTVDRVERIAQASQCANPLYLRVLLEELRLYGDNETIDQRIALYLATKTIPELYERVLARWEEDYEEGTHLVRDAMSLIWASRRGLYEAEMLDLLGQDGTSLPPARWSPLYLAAEASLVNRSGLIGFSHNFLRQAVENMYVPTNEHRCTAHSRIADYLEDQSLSVRKVDEMPWQLASCKKWQELEHLLTDIEFLEMAWNRDRYDVLRIWADLENNSEARIPIAYRNAWKATSVNAPRLSCLAELLGQTGHLSQSIELWRQVSESCQEQADSYGYHLALGEQAKILKLQCEFEEALQLWRQQEAVCRQIGDSHGLQASLGHQALILKASGQLQAALRLLTEQKSICRRLGTAVGLSACLHAEAGIYLLQGNSEKALQLVVEQEAVCRTNGLELDLQGCLNVQGMIYLSKGMVDRAITVHAEQEVLCREMNTPVGLQMCLGNQALCYIQRDDFDTALTLLKRRETLCAELGLRDGLQASLGNQAIVHMQQGRLAEALALLKTQEQICRELHFPQDLQAALGNQGNILRRQRKYLAAMERFAEQEKICRNAGYNAILADCLVSQSQAYLGVGYLEEAAEQVGEAISILKRLKVPPARIGQLEQMRTAIEEQIRKH